MCRIKVLATYHPYAFGMCVCGGGGGGGGEKGLAEFVNSSLSNA